MKTKRAAATEQNVMVAARLKVKAKCDGGSKVESDSKYTSSSSTHANKTLSETKKNLHRDTKECGVAEFK